MIKAKVYLSVLIVLTTLLSCNRNYTCSCITDYYNPHSQKTNEFTVNGKSKSLAEKSCSAHDDEMENASGGWKTVCSLK